MGWFKKKVAPNPLLRLIDDRIKARALDSIESRRVQIIYIALFNSDVALNALTNLSRFEAEKIKSSPEIKSAELLEKGLRETAWDTSSDGTNEILRSIIQDSSEKIANGCPSWLESDEDKHRIKYLQDQFEELTTLAFLLRKFYSLDDFIMFSNPSYLNTEIDKLKDFRLRTLVTSCMNLADQKGSGRFSGSGFEDAAFKATPISSFIESCWHISIKRFGEFAIHKTMMDDNNITLSRTYRSDGEFSKEIPLVLGS